MTMQTFTGLEYLKIDIANNYGLDKKTWDYRLNWFEQNQHQLLNLVPDAKEPALYYAGVKALKEVLAGQPIGYMVSLDATSSGIQILAALTGDHKAAILCNLVDSNDRQDAYTLIYEYMLYHTNEVAKIGRDQCKDAIMTAYYSSTAMPKLIFGEGKLLEMFYETLRTLSPAAWELNDTMLAMWNPEAYSHDWVLPDNFHVHIKVVDQVKQSVNFLNKPYDVFFKVNKPMESGRSLGANTTHSVDGMVVREMTARCGYDPKLVSELNELLLSGAPMGTGISTDADRMVMQLWKNYQRSGYLSVRILSFLNQGNIGHVDIFTITKLIQSLPRKPFTVVSIHDCFRCLPHYANDLRKQYNLQLHLIAKSNLLQDIMSQLMNKNIKINKLDPTLADDILDANYALS